jgi:hypothetical protein
VVFNISPGTTSDKIIVILPNYRRSNSTIQQPAEQKTIKQKDQTGTILPIFPAIVTKLKEDSML